MQQRSQSCRGDDRGEGRYAWGKVAVDSSQVVDVEAATSAALNLTSLAKTSPEDQSLYYIGWVPTVWKLPPRIVDSGMGAGYP